ncbi:hypothetical protein [Aureitalea marina]|nr:hypothetical protein [Aureitalea marina]
MINKSIYGLLFALILIGCKGKEGEEQTVVEGSEVVETEEIASADKPLYNSYRGEFIYVADGAVLNGKNFIYGVKLDSMAQVLADRVAPVKESEFDMVEVIVYGIVEPKAEGEEGWDEVLTIKEIVSVSETPSPAEIKLEEKN